MGCQPMFSQVQDDVSTYRILSEQYGINEMQTSREIRLTYATDEQAQLLDCPLGAPLFRMFKKVRDRNDAPVHLSYTYLNERIRQYAVCAAAGRIFFRPEKMRIKKKKNL